MRHSFPPPEYVPMDVTPTVITPSEQDEAIFEIDQGEEIDELEDAILDLGFKVPARFQQEIQNILDMHRVRSFAIKQLIGRARELEASTSKFAEENLDRGSQMWHELKDPAEEFLTVQFRTYMSRRLPDVSK